MPSRYPQSAPWESRNGYTPPPRFQQLRALDNLKQQQQQFGPGSLNMSPSHSRSLSLFTLFRSTKSTNAQISAAAPNYQPGQASSLQNPQNPQNQEPLTDPDALAQRPQQTNLEPFNQPQDQSPPQLRTSPNMALDPNSQQTGPIPNLSMQETSRSPPPPPNPIHPEIRSVVQLTVAHARKIYYAGPLVRKVERQADGQKPHKDDGWVEVWAQLGGTILSIWDMKETQEASKKGTEVPPSYVNVTDAVRIFHRRLGFCAYLPYHRSSFRCWVP
jgi:CCR4-NOT transcriptional complex subunit CAF120